MGVACGLNPGATLEKGHVIYSCGNRNELAMQADGNLVLYRRSDMRVLWNSETQGRGGDRVVMQGDGNLVIYDGGTARWNSHTNGQPGSALALQADGNMVVYAPGARWIWQTNTDEK